MVVYLVAVYQNSDAPLHHMELLESGKGTGQTERTFLSPIYYAMRLCESGHESKIWVALLGQGFKKHYTFSQLDPGDGD